MVVFKLPDIQQLGQHLNEKHCQRHNGPEGRVLLTKVTSSYTNLDQIPKFKISTKHQYFDQTLTLNLDQTTTSKHHQASAAKYLPNFSFKISLELQLQTLDQSSKILIKLQFQNFA